MLITRVENVFDKFSTFKTCSKLFDNFSTSFRQVFDSPKSNIRSPLYRAPRRSAIFSGNQNPNFLKPPPEPKIPAAISRRGGYQIFRFLISGPEIHFSVMSTMKLSSSKRCTFLGTGMSTVSSAGTPSPFAYFIHAVPSMYA